MSAAVLAAVLAGCACALLPAHLNCASPARGSPTSSAPELGAIRRHRLPLAGLAGVVGVVFIPGVAGLVVATVVCGVVWLVAGRVEPASTARRRERVRRDLPHVVRLLALSLSAGMGVPAAIRLVESALPESAGILGAAAARLELGVDEEAVWSELASYAELAPLGRAMVRAATVGASPAAVLGQLAEELADGARADVEDRARSVGIHAALPLGLCLLPAFVLIGIVPLVASTLSALSW